MADQPELPWASASALAIAMQTDRSYRSMLANRTHAAIRALFGQALAARASPFVELISDALYMALSTGIGIATLGEEYAGSVLVEAASQQAPATLRRLFAIVCQLLGPVAVELCLSVLQSSTAASCSPRLHSALGLVRLLLPYVHRFHLALLLLFGQYAHLSKRMAGLRLITLVPVS
jgi:hypothetical protein